MVQINACDSLTDWSTLFGTDALEGTDKQEGTNSIKVTGDGTPWNMIEERYDTGGADYSSFADLVFWCKSNETNALQIRLEGANYWADYFSWNVSPANWDTWEEFTKDLSTPDTTVGSPNLNSIRYVTVRCQQNDGGEIYLIDDIRVESAGGISIPVAMHHYNHHIAKIIRG